MHNKDTKFAMMSTYVTPLVISAIGIVCFTLAIAVYHCILLRFFVRHYRTQGRNNNNNNNTITSHIKNDAGVQEEILNKIPVFSISITQRSDDDYDAFDLDQQNECSICLGQWEHGDVVRLLPSCNHAFHRPCIDAWFMDHANCPICRSQIICDCDLAFPNMASQNFGDDQQRVLQVHGNINIPSNHHNHTLINDDVSGSTSTPRIFQRPRPMLLHTHSLSSHVRRKPLIMGLKRSLSLDETSSYIAITIQRDQVEGSISSSTKGVIMSTQYNYISSSRKHLDHMSSVLMRSFSQFRNSESGRYNAILPN